MPHLIVAAAHKSSGKTTVSIGLARALKARGVAVQTFKKGPDYIDPMWLSRASGRPCYNLDYNTQSREEIDGFFASRSAAADLALIEGNKGLYDGVDLEGRDSNAALAKQLGAPVVLVVDTEGITRGVAPLLLGYRVFDPEIVIAGVILNKVAGPRHEGKLRAAVERYTDLLVLGAIGRRDELALSERHLGLTTPAETGAQDARIARIADAVALGVDLDRIRGIAALATPVRGTWPVNPPRVGGERVRIAIARDTAFGFYYPDDLEAMEAAGAELVAFDTATAPRLPDCDGLFIGGGFPETQAAALARNASLRADIRALIEAGLPAYAECGGLMYLSRSIVWGAESHAMVGVIPGDAVMGGKPQGRGHVRLEETGAGPWPMVDGLGGEGFSIKAHEFHYAGIRGLPDNLQYAYKLLRGDGIDGRRDGIVMHNLLAGFSHQRHTAANPWARRFVAFVRACKAKRDRAQAGASDAATA